MYRGEIMLSINKDQIMMEHYKEIIQASDTSVRVRFEEYVIKVSGRDLHILALASSEIYLAGHLESIAFLYEK